MQKRTFFITLTIFFSTFFYLNSWADEKDENVAQQFLQHGVLLYQNNDVRGAVANFCRTLLLDFENEEARGYLVKISHQIDLPVEERIALVAVDDLFAVLINLKNQQKYYEEKLVFLIQELKERGFQDLNFPLSDQNDVALLPGGGQSDQESPLDILFKVLQTEKVRLNKKIDELKAQHTQLKSLNQASHDLAGKKTVGFSEQSKEAAYQRTGQDSVDDLTALRNEVVVLNQRYHGIEQHVHGRTDQLSKQIVDLSLKFSETELLLKEKAAMLASLEEGWKELESRFELGQKIIQEKDKAINNFRSNVIHLRSAVQRQRREFEEVIRSKDEKLIELSGILSIYKGKLADTTKVLHTYTRREQNLKEQLNFSHDQLSERNQSIQNVEDNIQELKKQLIQLREELVSFYKAPPDTDLHQAKYQKADQMTRRFDQILLAIEKNLSDLEKMDPALAAREYSEIQKILDSQSHTFGIE